MSGRRRAKREARVRMKLSTFVGRASTFETFFPSIFRNFTCILSLSFLFSVSRRFQGGALTWAPDVERDSPFFFRWRASFFTFLFFLPFVSLCFCSSRYLKKRPGGKKNSSQQDCCKNSLAETTDSSSLANNAAARASSPSASPPLDREKSSEDENRHLAWLLRPLSLSPPLSCFQPRPHHFRFFFF